MSLFFAILIAALAFGAYRLADDYVRRSMRSFASAERVWNETVSVAQSILDRGVPQSVARVVAQLMAAAGCGCFVRGILIGHYLPRFSLARNDSPTPLAKGFSDIENLDAESRSEIWKLMALVIAYDSFRNPLQGWLFRHTLKAFTSPPSQINMGAKLEAQLTAFSVLGRRAAAI